MPVTTDLVITRHGEAVCNTTGIVGGPATCTGLTSRGRAQVAALAARLNSDLPPFDTLLTSPRARAMESARILAEILGLEPVVVDELRGPDHGQADGRPWQEVKDAFGGNPQRHPDRPYAPGAEPWTTYLHRAAAALLAQVTEHNGERILVAGHGETVAAAHALFLELPNGLSVRTGFTVDHASLTRWQLHMNKFDHPTWMLVTHNDTAHLARPAEPRHR